MSTMIQYVLYLAILVVLAIPLGSYIKNVMSGEKTFLSKVLTPCENLIYKVLRVDREEQMTWKKYAVSVMIFSGIGLVFLFLLQLLQGVLPGNPQNLSGVKWDLAFNTSASFITNTNWQAYSGESTLSYLTQALGLTVQNFVSAATGIAVLFALIRGFIKVKSSGLGSFWVDLTRIVVHILLPLNLVISLLLVGGGVIQNLKSAETVSLVEPIAVSAEGEILENAVIDLDTETVTVDGEIVSNAQIVTEQFVPMGPAASQVAIKQTGTNGGGYMGVNSAHPLENPNAFTNLIEMISILLIPAALCFTFGSAVKNKKQGTVLFANFAEAIAEGRGKAQADSLRASRKDVDAHKIPSVSQKDSVTVVPSALLKKGELVIVKAGEQIPADGEVIEGAASVDESAITGESAPVIREAGGDRSAVTGGTTVLSDWIVVRVTNEAGESFLDKMIAMVEGAARKKTPNEIALQIFLVALSIIFILVTVSLYTYSIFSAKLAGIENPTSVTTLVALLVCLAPTTIGALLSAIGIAGMSRLNQANVLAMSGRAIEAAGDVDILMLDKTGTITLGNRQASEFIPVDGVDIQELADAAQLSSLADETPEGRSVVVLAKEQFGIRGRSLQDKNMHFVPFTAVTRMSGVDFDGNEIRKGAADAMQSYVTHAGGMYSPDCDRVVKSIASKGGTPLVVAKNHKILGVIYLKDIIKQGVKEKFADLRKMGIKTIMITGDNPITAAAIAAEAGVDDFLAEATPEGKLAMIRDFQAKGHLVAMTGDGTNDAPALAQADVAVAMNSGTQAAKEAGNMVDLDSSPTKLIDIVRIGKQLLMTRGSLTTFSIANDVAKYFAIIPALFMGLYPGLSALNIMGLHSPQSAVLSAIIYNALIIIALIPLALKGVKYREVAAGKLLSRNLLVYGLGGLAAPFIFVKLIDVLLVFTGLV